MVRNQPTMQEIQEMWVRSLGWENPLEKEMATRSSILGGKVSWTEEPGGLFFFLNKINGNWNQVFELLYHIELNQNLKRNHFQLLCCH